MDEDFLDARLRRRLALGSAIGFAALALLTYWIPGIDAASAQWISGMFAKLAVVVGAIWVAFPQIEALRKIRGGSTILTTGLVLAAVFLIRPKAVTYVLPIAVVAMVIMVGLAWFSKRGSRKL